MKTNLPPHSSNQSSRSLLAFGFVLLLMIPSSPLLGQGTAFTYEGRLNDGTNPANGNYDLTFALFNDVSGAGQVGDTVTNSATAVVNGLFSVTLDFGNQFPGADRWLEIGVRTNGPGAFTTLAPRQKLTPTPYAITAANVPAGGGLAGTYSNAVTFNNAANNFSGSFAGNGAGVGNVNALTLGGISSNGFWKATGNAGTTPGANFLGTTDNQPLSVKVNNKIALQFTPGTTLPNVVGGLAAFRPSVIAPGVSGAVIAGGNAPSGGVTGQGGGDFQAVYDNDGTVGGGFGNKVGSDNGNPTDAAFATVAGGVFNGAGGYAAAVAGGDGNFAAAQRSFIGGGYGNLGAADYSSIGGGILNSIPGNAPGASIGGGSNNTIQANATASTIGGGERNIISVGARDAVIGGGFLNTNGSSHSVIGGGQNNTLEPFTDSSVIGGGWLNFIQSGADQSVISGGNAGHIRQGARESFIGGGFNNTIQTNSAAALIGGGAVNFIGTNALYSSIVGGINNLVQPNSRYAAIGGGFFNSVGCVVTNRTIFGATVSGGEGNRADSDYSFVGGGRGNTISDFLFLFGFLLKSPYSVIAGGEANHIGPVENDPLDYDHSTIGGGFANEIQGATHAVISGGANNLIFEGNWSVIPGGQNNEVRNYWSYAAGRRAKALHSGTFVWADSQDADFASSGNNQFDIRASGGVRLNTDTSVFCGNQTRQMLNLWGTQYGIGVQTGTAYFRSASDFSWFKGGGHNNNQNDPGVGGTEMMRLQANGNLLITGVFGPLSDRNVKENFEPLNPREMLEKLVALPLSRWSYKTDPSSRHLGPMAQDFYAAFGVGIDDKHIATVDADGVALAAIQGLNEKLEIKGQESKSRIQKLEVENAELKQRLEALEKIILSQGVN